MSGELMVTGCVDGMVRLWDMKDGTLLRELEGHWGMAGAINCLRFDKYTVVSGGDDDAFMVWRMQEEAIQAALTGCDAMRIQVQAARGLPQFKQQKDDEDCLRRPYAVLHVDGVEQGRTGVKESTVDPDWYEEFTLKAVRADSVIKIETWDDFAEECVGFAEFNCSVIPRLLPETWFPLQSTGDVSSFGEIKVKMERFDPVRSNWAVGDIQKERTKVGDILGNREGIEEAVYVVEYDDRYIVTGMSFPGKNLLVWSVSDILQATGATDVAQSELDKEGASRTNKFPVHLFEHEGFVTCAKLRGKWLASGSHEADGTGVVRLWHLETGQMAKEWRDHTGAIRAVDFRYPHLITGSDDGTCNWYNMDTGNKLHSYNAGCEISDVIIGVPMIFVSTLDGRVQLLDLTEQLQFIREDEEEENEERVYTDRDRKLRQNEKDLQEAKDQLEILKKSEVSDSGGVVKAEAPKHWTDELSS
eukprot:GFYU01011642.1.p1 GENE.GFYU01011642.1~~GFYU01011642.1.p1  ORF type:complete len:503 (+),score=168.45 GFYU01011642.1:92-1510(+)